MKLLLLLAALTVSSSQAVSQTNDGIIEGRVTRLGSSEGISDVQITLYGPGAADPASEIRAIYTPNPNLTPAMRAEIDTSLAYPYPTSIEALVNNVRRQEARLLGLPEPPALPASPLSQSSVMSDRDGRFSFRNLGPGRYLFRVRRDGYSGGGDDRSRVLTVVAGQKMLPVAIELLPPVTVSGTVRSSNGQPITGIQVDAFAETYLNGRRVLSSVGSNKTDDRGQYRLYGLPSGDYKIAASPRRSTASGNTDLSTRTFYSNVVDARTAQTIQVTGGAEASGVDIVLRLDATGSISGQVVGSIGGESERSSVATRLYLFNADPETLPLLYLFGAELIGRELSNSSSYAVGSFDPSTGKFDIRGVVPGEYELMASASDHTGKSVWGRTRTNARSNEVTGVTVDIRSGVEFKARLRIDDAPPSYAMNSPVPLGSEQLVAAGLFNAEALKPVPTPSFRVRLESAESLPVAPFDPNYPAAAYDPSGVFTFSNVVEGKYIVSVSPLPANGYVADVRAGGRSVLDSGVDINSQTGEVQVLVRINGAKIQGVVRDSTGKSIPSARVALVPPASRRGNTQLYRSSSSDTNGNFTMNGIAPGEYKLFAWESVTESAWMNGTFLEPYEGRGQTIVVGSNTPNIELKIISKQGGEVRNR
jgi:hypothetical protein